MNADNTVFRKIKEISARGMQPRPSITTLQLANELALTPDSLLLSLNQLQELKLLNFCDDKASAIKLTYLGSVVKRDK